MTDSVVQINRTAPVIANCPASNLAGVRTPWRLQLRSRAARLYPDATPFGTEGLAGLTWK